MSDRRRIRDRRLNTLSLTVLSAGAGYLVVFAIAVIMSLIISKTNVGGGVISVLTSLALCCGAYVGGFVSAKHRRNNGLAMGVLCGLFMFVVILVVGIFLAGKVSGFSMPVKFVITLIFGAIGGVVGVNSKHKRY